MSSPKLEDEWPTSATLLPASFARWKPAVRNMAEMAFASSAVRQPASGVRSSRRAALPV